MPELIVDAVGGLTIIDGGGKASSKRERSCFIWPSKSLRRKLLVTDSRSCVEPGLSETTDARLFSVEAMLKNAGAVNERRTLLVGEIVKAESFAEGGFGMRPRSLEKNSRL
jgi:hypothetical protein